MTSDQKALQELAVELQAAAPRLAREELAEALAPLIALIRRPQAALDGSAAADTVIGVCRTFYAGGLSCDALPLASALLAHAGSAGDPVLRRRALSLAGLLSGDSGDVAGALEYHIGALRLAEAQGNQLEACSVWNNLGHTLAIPGNYALAARCYERALAKIAGEPAPCYSRYTIYSNLASNSFLQGDNAAGLAFAKCALGEQTATFVDRDPHAALLLRRNLVRLLIAEARVPEALPHVEEAIALAARSPSPRSRLAAALTRAAYELALGRNDIALTRLEKALDDSRRLPATLRDTLVAVVRAEEQAGNVERALERLRELSDSVYNSGIASAQRYREFAELRIDHLANLDHARRQSRARLIGKLAPPSPPPGWEGLRRLSVSAALRMDPSGWHGLRVATLTKALALAWGCAPLEALAIGLAAEVHDIGMVAVPESILGKHGELNDVERHLVRRHTEAGAEILRDDRHPRMLLARDISRYHHARWDGLGYPERVAGEQIPLPARMCAIADAYDIMLTGIGGGRLRSLGEALEALREAAGTQFDPQLVRCFESAIHMESHEHGIELASQAGLESFQALICALREDKGFV